jgi:DNA-binding IclR family transcriptional regulator
MKMPISKELLEILACPNGKDAAALAFPIFSGNGKVEACLSIQTTVYRLTNKNRKKFIREGIQASKRISTLLA